jgi:hypothetical protein
LHVCMNISGFRHHKENRLKNSRRLFSLDNYWCLYSTWFEKREANPIKYCVYSTRRTASVISRADIPGWRRLSLSLSTCLSQNLVRPQTAFVFMGTTYLPTYTKKLTIRGRCYDHNFLRFLTIFSEIIGVFLKNQCYDQICA